MQKRAYFMQRENVKRSAAEDDILSFWSTLTPGSAAPVRGPEDRTRYITDKYVTPCFFEGEAPTRKSAPPDLGTIPARRAGDAPSREELAATPHTSPQARLQVARRLSDCPARISGCGRVGFQGLPDLVSRVSEKTGLASGGWHGVAACGHRWCPYCGPRDIADTASKVASALDLAAAEGWRVGLAVLTFPHLASTPATALVHAIRAGFAAISATLKTYRTPAAIAAAKTLKKADLYELSETQRATLRATIRAGSLLWWGRVELTIGKNGLHPHINCLLLIPPTAAAPEGIYKGLQRGEDGRAHLSSIEAKLYDAWTAATLRALRRWHPAQSGRYRAPDADLDDERADAERRVAELRAEPVDPSGFVAERQSRALAGALLDLDRARVAAFHDSPERLEARRVGVSAYAWEGAVGAAAHYALGLGGGAAPSSDWSLGSEWGGAGKPNDLWRCLDTAGMAPRWAAWCRASEGVRMTRASRGLVAWLEQLAEDAAAARDEEPSPSPSRVAVAHPLALQWSRDQGRERELLAAAGAGTAALAAWWTRNAPAPLLPLLEVLPVALPLDLDDPEELTARRRRLIEAHEASGLGWGYWMGADGRPSCTGRPAPSPETVAQAQALEVIPALERFAITRGVAPAAARRLAATLALATAQQEPTP